MTAASVRKLRLKAGLDERKTNKQKKTTTISNPDVIILTNDNN